MRLRFFKKNIEIKGVDFFKFIGFIVFAVTSAYFSLNLFLELGKAPNEKIAMILLAVGIEALKVFTVIMLNGFTTSFKYYFRLRKHSKLHAIISFEKLRAAFLYGVIYLVVAATSVTATLGFGLTTVNRYNEEHKITVVSTSSEVDFLKKDVVSYQEEIVANNSLIEDAKASIAEIRSQAKSMDKETGGYLWYQGQYQKKIDAYNKKIETYGNKIAEIRLTIISINKQMSSLIKKEGTEIKNANAETTSMFELIARALKIKDPTVVMFFMMFVIAVVVEIGILTTSPHVQEINESADIEKLLAVVDPQKLRRKIDKQRKKEHEPEETNVPVKEVIREEVGKFISASSGDVIPATIKVEPEPVKLGVEPRPLFKKEEPVTQPTIKPSDNVKETQPIEKQNTRNGLLAPMQVKNNPMMREKLERKGLLTPEQKEKSPLDEIDNRGYPKVRKGFDIKKLNDIIDGV